MKLALLASNLPKCTPIKEALISSYPFVSASQCDVILCVGGDGFMLHSLHDYLKYNKPFYGINGGTIGFLLNKYSYRTLDNLINKIKQAIEVKINPLLIDFEYADGKDGQNIAFNETYLFRTGSSSCHLKISIDNKIAIPQLISDGALVASPSGSTAYNKACRGPVLPLESPMLALTPINAFSPSNWNGTVVRNKHNIFIESLDYHDRPTDLYCDFHSYKNVRKIKVQQSKDFVATLLFDNEQQVEDKFLKFQFGQF